MKANSFNVNAIIQHHNYMFVRSIRRFFWLFAVAVPLLVLLAVFPVAAVAVVVIVVVVVAMSKVKRNGNVCLKSKALESSETF